MHLGTMLSTKNVRNSAVSAWTCQNSGHAQLFLYKSSACLLSTGLAHIFFHSLCEKLMLRPSCWTGVVGKTSCHSPFVAWERWAGMVVLKIRAGEFFCLKSMVLRYRKALPHNFVHRKCEEAHTCSVRAPAGRSASIPRSVKRRRREQCITISGPHRFVHSPGLNRALQYFARLNVVLAQKSGDWKIWRIFKHLSCRGRPCAHSFPQKVCIVPSLPSSRRVR